VLRLLRLDTARGGEAHLLRRVYRVPFGDDGEPLCLRVLDLDRDRDRDLDFRSILLDKT
jgi:hypothetical protein